MEEIDEKPKLELTIPDAVSQLVPIGSLGKLPIYNSSQLRRRGFFMLVYGRGNVDKTTLAGSIADNPNVRPVLGFDIDRHTFVLGHRKDIDIAYIHDYAQMQAAAMELQEGHPYRAIFIDGLTALNDMCLEYNADLINSKDPRQHYAAQTSDMLRFMKFWRDYVTATGITVIMTALEGASEDELTGLKKSSVLFNPALQLRFEGMFPMVGYLDVDETDQSQVLYLGQHKRRITIFNRSPGDVEMTIPLVIKNPNLGKIARTLIEGQPYENDQEKEGTNA